MKYLWERKRERDSETEGERGSSSFSEVRACVLLKCHGHRRCCPVRHQPHRWLDTQLSSSSPSGTHSHACGEQHTETTICSMTSTLTITIYPNRSGEQWRHTNRVSKLIYITQVKVCKKNTDPIGKPILQPHQFSFSNTTVNYTAILPLETRILHTVNNMIL